MTFEPVEKLAKYFEIYTSQLNIKVIPLDMYWFLRYGTPIMMATIINTVLFPTIILIQSIIKFTQDKLSNATQKLHKEYISAIPFHNFSFEGILPNLVCFTLTSLVLLPGMSMMTLCLFGLMLSQFWIQKYLFINSNSSLNNSHKKTFKILIKGIPLALILSLMSGIIVYTNWFNTPIDDFIKCDSYGECDTIQFMVRDSLQVLCLKT